MHRIPLPHLRTKPRVVVVMRVSDQKTVSRRTRHIRHIRIGLAASCVAALLLSQVVSADVASRCPADTRHDCCSLNGPNCCGQSTHPPTLASAATCGLSDSGGCSETCCGCLCSPHESRPLAPTRATASNTTAPASAAWPVALPPDHHTPQTNAHQFSTHLTHTPTRPLRVLYSVWRN